MSWIKIEKRMAPVVPVGAKLALRVSKRSSSLMLTLPAGPCGARGWDKYEKADVFFGEGEHLGQVMVGPSSSGLMKLVRWRSAVKINVPGQAGWPGTSMKFKQVELGWGGNGEALITLPPEFLNPVAANPPPVVLGVATPRAGKQALRPRELSCVGNVVSLGPKSIRLNQLSMKAFGLLEKAWGEFVRSENLANTLDLPGVDLAAFMRAFRDKIAPLGLVVIHQNGVGYSLKLSPEA